MQGRMESVAGVQKPNELKERTSSVEQRGTSQIRSGGIVKQIEGNGKEEETDGII